MIKSTFLATGLFIAVFSLALGISLPIIQLEKLFLFDDTYSIWGMTLALFADGDFFLGIVIFLFSILLPCTKLVFILAHMQQTEGTKHSKLLLQVVNFLGKWSMLDVLLVALVLFAVKTSGLGSATSQPGLYFFALSVVLTMILSQFIGKPKTAEQQANN